jgi:hypothetical protein
VTKVCQNPMFFDPLGLTSSEKHIPQVIENTAKTKVTVGCVGVGGNAPKAGALFQALPFPNSESTHRRVVGMFPTIWTALIHG